MDDESQALASYLAYLDDIQRVLSQDTWVYPGHGPVFQQAVQRSEDLITHHHGRLDTLMTHLAGDSATIYQSLPVLFKRLLQDRDLLFALGEALAHAQYLLTQERIHVDNEDGVYRMRAR